MLNYERARNRNVGRTVEYRLCLQYWKQRMFNRQRPLVTFSEVAFSIQDIFYFSASVVRQIKSLYNNRMLFFVHSIFLWCPIDISKKNHVCTYFFIFFFFWVKGYWENVKISTYSVRICQNINCADFSDQFFSKKVLKVPVYLDFEYHE